MPRIYTFSLPNGNWSLKSSTVDWQHGIHYFLFEQDQNGRTGEYEPLITDYRVWRSSDDPDDAVEMEAVMIAGHHIERHGPVTVNQDTGGGGRLNDDRKSEDSITSSPAWRPFCFNLGRGPYSLVDSKVDGDTHTFTYKLDPTNGSISGRHCPLVTDYGPGNRGQMYGVALIGTVQAGDRQGPVQVNQDTGGGK